MNFEQFGTMVAPIATILVASAWLHSSLNRIATKVEVLSTKLDDYGERIRRMEQELDELRRRTP
jgi:hypothetical protein